MQSVVCKSLPVSNVQSQQIPRPIQQPVAQPIARPIAQPIVQPVKPVAPQPTSRQTAPTVRFVATDIKPVVSRPVTTERVPVETVARALGLVPPGMKVKEQATPQKPKLPPSQEVRTKINQVQISQPNSGTQKIVSPPKSTAKTAKPVAKSTQQPSRVTKKLNKKLTKDAKKLAKKSAKTTPSKTQKPPKSTKAKAGKMLRYSLTALIMTAAGYLAFDVWTNNRQARDFLSQPVSAMTVAGDTLPDQLDEVSISNENLADYTVAADMPRYITISKIGVRARVLNVGVTKVGQVDVPKSIHDVGWYNGSSKPGSPGAAFIDGHTAGSNLSGVFAKLDKLVAGDIINVEMGDGTTIYFRVATSEVVRGGEIDMAKALTAVYGGEQGLNLMSCDDGVGDQRVLVYATRI